MSELNDGFDLPSDVDGLNHMHMGAESTDELGMATVEVRTHSSGSGGFFDNVKILDLAGETVVLAQEAIEVEGEPHLIPTQIIPWKEVKDIQVPLDDGRLEETDGERIGVNG